MITKSTAICLKCHRSVSEHAIWAVTGNFLSHNPLTREFGWIEPKDIDGARVVN